MDGSFVCFGVERWIGGRINDDWLHNGLILYITAYYSMYGRLLAINTILKHTCHSHTYVCPFQWIIILKHNVSYTGDNLHYPWWWWWWFPKTISPWSLYFLFCFSNTLHINGFHNTRCDCVAFAPQIHNKYKLFIIIITNSVPNAAIYSIAFYACVCECVCLFCFVSEKSTEKNLQLPYVFCCFVLLWFSWLIHKQ